MSTTSPSQETGTAAAFTLRQRLALWFISWLGYLLISLIGCTLRFEYSSEPGGEVEGGEPPPFVIGPFWHRCVIPATWCFRGRGMAVMTSRSFDGEYIARIIERFGFVAVRGSSSRGGSGALLGMNRALAGGRIAAFTIDGPQRTALYGQARPGDAGANERSAHPVFLSCGRSSVDPAVRGMR